MILETKRTYLREFDIKDALFLYDLNANLK